MIENVTTQEENNMTGAAERVQYVGIEEKLSSHNLNLINL